MASTVTRSQSSQACLGCGGKGDSRHRRGADQSAATVWWCHANLDQNLWGIFRAHYWICATKAEWDTAWHQRGLPNKVVSGIKKHTSHMKFSSFPNLNYITGNTGKDIDKSFKRHFPPIIQPFPPSAPSPVLWFMFFSTFVSCCFMSNTLRLFLWHILFQFVWFVMKEFLLITTWFMMFWIKRWDDQKRRVRRVALCSFGTSLSLILIC